MFKSQEVLQRETLTLQQRTNTYCVIFTQEKLILTNPASKRVLKLLRCLTIGGKEGI